MANYPSWLNQLRKNLQNLHRNPHVKRVQNQLNSSSEQVQKALNKQYKNAPHYKSQLKSQYSNLKQHSKEFNTQFQQKFHEFSQTNTKFKHYHSQYQTKINQISKNIPTMPSMPHLNVKKSIDSTIKQSKKISSNIQSSAKQVSNASQKVSSSISASAATLSKIPSAASNSMKSTYKTTQKLLNPNTWTSKLYASISKMKKVILIYGFVGIASLMMVNQLTYMGLVYAIRHRYDEDHQLQLFGINMSWIYSWLNIPYDQSNVYNKTKTKKIDDREGYIEEIQMQDYNVQVDMRLAQLAYNGLLYPRIGVAILMTFVVGFPLLRIVRFLK